MTMAHNALMAISRLEIGMLGDEGRNLGFDGLGEQHSRTIAKNFGERIGKASWLNQLGDVILGHGISLLWWRSEVVKQPHDMPPSPIHAVTDFCA